MKGSERRQVTVLFADISGFTSLSERQDPETVTSLMNECFGLLGKVVADHGGTIDKYIGDCIMALFGVPQALEDSAARAVHSALQMRKLLREWRDAKGLADPVDIHIGINSGETITGEVGSDVKRDFTVMGDAVNVASRLKDAAGHGQIYVGPVTWRHTRDAFDYKDPEPISLKGKEKPVLVYELLGSATRVSPAGREHSDRLVFSELVGRRHELDRLELQALKVINGEGSIVFVVAEAGIGKSRLVAEFLDKECMKRVTLLQGSAQSMGGNLSFHPFIDMLDRWAGVREEDSPADIAARLEAAIRDAAPEEADEIIPFVAIMRGLTPAGVHAERVRGISGEVLSKFLLKSVRDLLRCLARRRPVALVLEDLHWADASSLELLRSLLRLAEQESVLFLSALRPGEPSSDRLVSETAEAHGSRWVTLRLAPLDRAEAETMFANLLRKSALPRALIDAIVQRTSGNPFFMEEIVRSWVDEGAVKASRSGFQITDRIAEAAIPYTVNQAVLSRIDRLEEGSRAILRIASVIGRSFFYRLLAAIAADAEEIDATVERLKELQLIYEQRRMEEVEFLFKHALVQQAIYDSLLLQERRKLHLDVARAVESIFEARLPEFYGILAFHYVRAEDTDKAEAYLVRAADTMLATSASSEAIGCYGEALSLYLKRGGDKTDPIRAARLEKSIAFAYFNKGHYIEAVEHFDAALSYLGVRPKSGVSRAFGAIAGMVALMRLVYLPRRRHLRAPSETDRQITDILPRRAAAFYVRDSTRYVTESLSACGFLARFELGGDMSLRLLLSFLSGVASIAGFPVLSRRILERASPSGVALTDLEDAVKTHAAAQLRFLSGHLDDSVFLAYPDVRSYKGDLAAVVNIVAYCGLAAMERADHAEVWKRIEQLRYLAEELDNIDARVNLHEMRAKYAVKIGAARESSDHIEKGIAAAQAGNQASMLIYFHGMKGYAELLLRDPEACERSLEQSEALMRQEGLVMPHFRIRHDMARLALELWRLEGALRGRLPGDSARQARRTSRVGAQALACSRKSMADRVEALRNMGTLSWLLGRKRKAVEYWRESMETGERIGARLELARTWMEVGGRLLEDGAPPEGLDGVAGQEYLSRARSFFTEKKLAWDLSNLDHLMGN